MLFGGLLISLTTIVACRKNILDTAQVTQLPENKEKSLSANAQPNTNPELEDYVLEMDAGCNYINSATHPDSLYKTIDCYNKAPTWWPNLNQKVFYPNWVWQHAGGYDPNNYKKLQLQVPPGEVFFLPPTDKDGVYQLLKSKIQQNFTVRQNKYDLLSVADFGLTPAEVLFLDNYFAEKMLLIDGLRASFPNNSGVSLEDSSILELYMQFKTRADFLSASLNNLPPNFFGENNNDHLSQFLYAQYSNQGFYINWNVPQYWVYRTTQVSSVFDVPIFSDQKLYVILPKYYFYLMVDPTLIRTEYLFIE